jgi:hypothetical protein
MFLQVGARKEDRVYLLFLWESQGEARTFEFIRLVFGLNTSPFLAQFVTQENALLHIEEFPRAAETIIRSTYMDDSIDSVGTEEEALGLIKHLKILWGKAGMKAIKWISNSIKVMESIPIEEKAKGIDFENMEIKTKTLGVS